MVAGQMNKLIPLFAAAGLLLLMSCAGGVSEKDLGALKAELEACRQDVQRSRAERDTLASDLARARADHETESKALSDCTSSRQELLDRNIECLEETRSLLRQISRFKTLTQERKDTQSRLERAYDTLGSALKEERSSNLLYIVKTEATLTVVIPQSSLFPTEHSAWLTPRGAELARRVAGAVKNLRPMTVSVAGHTDSQPLPPNVAKTYPTLWDLAMARAVIVLRVFETAGVGRERISAVSYADTRPVADNKTESGRAMNRRVEIVIVP